MRIKIKPMYRNTGVILGRAVNIRSKPNLKARIIFQLKENSYIRIIGVNKKIYRIGEFSGKWTKVISARGIKGYIFDAFIFDLDCLYKKVWKRKVELKIWLNFFRNGKYKWRRANALPITDDKPLYEIITGKFKIIGRKIILYENNNPNVFSFI